MAGVEELRSKLADVQQEVRKQAERERYLKRKRASDANPECTTTYVKRCCIHVYVLSDFNMAMAVAYLRKCHVS